MNDSCNLADSWPGSPSNHHTMHSAVSLPITHNVQKAYKCYKTIFLAVKELIVNLKFFLFNYGGCFIYTMFQVELSQQIVIELQP